MQTGFLIKNGLVVDGTGAEPFAADVRVREGVIVDVAPGLEREGRERIVDAEGCFVTPGFIEVHNHFDGPMWWMPTLEPMPGYGVTTSINGNCGFSAAPVHEDPRVRKEMVDIFSFFEDIPEKPFLELLPWDWRTWSEYKASLQKHVKISANYAAYVGHLAIRLAVMGLEAWDREATPEEIARMCSHLDDALNAGSLGLSSNLLDHDANDRPVPTYKASDDEWNALFAVVARHEGAVVQIIVDYLKNMTAPETLKRIGDLARPHGIRVQFAGGVPTLQFAETLIPGAFDDFKAQVSEGLDVWMSYHHRSPTIMINFVSSLMFAQSNNYVWSELIQAKTEEAKFALLSDPAWRARAREGWDQTFPQSPLSRAEEIFLVESESGAGPIGISLKELMQERNTAHPSDALAEWVLDNGVRSILKLGDVANHDDALMRMFREPRGLGNVSDSGAHGQMFCGIGDNVLLLTKYVRDEKKLTIEEAIHILTGQIAGHFFMNDRGTIAPGKAADIAVFKLDEIECRPEEKRWDVPDGEGGRTFRWSRAPAPMRLTLVNGIPTFDNGDFTGNFPGQFIGPATEQAVPA